MRILCCLVIAALSTDFAPPSSFAADQALTGKRLLLGTKEGKPQKQRLQVLSKDRTTAPGDGPQADPTRHGGSLRVFSANGGFDTSYQLLPGGWKPISKRDPSKGWKYVKGDPIKKVFVRTGKQLQILGRGAGLGHVLDADPAPVDVVLTVGDERYCMRFGGTATHLPGRRFKAVDASAPAGCPGSASTTTTVPPSSTSTSAPTSSTVTTTSTTVTTTTSLPNLPPEIVSSPVAGEIVLDQITQQVDVSGWTAVQSTATSSGGDANWVVATDGLSVLQTNNSNPAFFLSDFNVVDAVIDGTFTVETTNDDDIIGFVFGYQDVNHFYLFDWKQTDQSFCSGFADAGMTVKTVTAGTNLACIDLWDTDGAPGRVANLYHNTIPWADNVTYGFTLDFSPGQIRIEVRQGATVLDTIAVSDSTYGSGLFGFYNNSQNAVRYTGFTETTIVPGSYTYDVEATDPDGDTLSYALTQAPPGMTIDTITGVIGWIPGGAHLGSHDVTVRVSDGNGGVDEQSFTLVVSAAPVVP